MNHRYIEKFIEIAGRIGSQQHLVAIRNGFVAIMPLVIAGSLAIIVNNFPPLGKFDLVLLMDRLLGEGNWQVVGQAIWNGTFAILGLLATFSVAYHLAKSYHIDGLLAGLIGVSAYIILAPVTADGGLNMAWLGTQGLFVGIIIALVLTEAFRFLLHSKLKIRMPDGIPEGVSKSFSAFIPGLIILVIVGLFQSFMSHVADQSIFEFIFYIIQEPLQGISNTLLAAIFVALLTHVLWFFGLHGTNITGGVIEPIYLPLIQKNAQLYKEGMSAFEVPYLITKPFLDSFVFMGGSGTTLALLLAIFIVVRKERKHHSREIAKIAIPSGIFNINEPALFGLPIVLNPVMLIPFISVPIILTITSYVALATGLVPKTVAMLPWTTPPIISGYLVTGGDWRGIALQVVNLTVAVLIYIPFVMAGVRTPRERTEA